MSKRTFIGLVVLLVLLGVIVWATRHKNTMSDQASTPLLSVYAYNKTKNLPAQQAEASANDVIVYTLSVENQSNKVIPGYIVEVNIAQVTDKSTLTDASGASYNSATNSLVWTPLDIPANGQIQKEFTVRVNQIAAGADSMMKIKFDNEIDVTIASSTVAGVKTDNPAVTYKAPVTGPADNLALWFAVLTTIAFAIVKKYRLVKA